MQQHPRLFARLRPEGRVSKIAKIFLDPKAPVIEWVQEYKLEKDQKPAKLVFSGSKTVNLEIAFSFKDVPLK